MIVFGDFNYNLLKRSQPTSAYKRTIKEDGFFILNNIDPKYSTRETQTTRTILDHVCTNIKNQTFNLAIVESVISDHKHIYLEVNKLKTTKNKKTKYETINYEKFSNLLKDMKLSDCNNEYEKLEKMLLDTMKICKETKTKILNPPKSDWINKEVIQAISKRNELGYTYIHSEQDNEIAKKEYLAERKKVQEYIQSTKSQYYLRLFKNCVKTPLKMWRLINDLSNNKVKSNSAPTKLETHLGPITDLKEICQYFNKFFANIGSVLANNIPQSFHIVTEAHVDNCGKPSTARELLDFNPATVEEVSKIIDNLNSNTSSGLDGMSSKALKSVKKYNFVRTDAMHQ